MLLLAIPTYLRSSERKTTNIWRLPIFMLFLIVSSGFPAYSDTTQAKHFRLGVQSALKAYNANGVIWGNSVIYDIFERAGYQIEVIDVPALRLPVSLAEDKIDSYMFTEGGGQDSGVLLRSELPLSVVTYYIYYDHRKAWRPQWPPDEVFLAKEGKSQDSALTLQNRNKLNISRSSSYENAVKMVNQGRATYWIEHRAGIAKVAPGLIKDDSEGFTLEPLYQSGLYAGFQPSERGSRLLNIFNQEHRALLESGRYGDVFFQHDPNDGTRPGVTDVINFINREYPDLNIPLPLPLQDSALQ